MLEGHKERKGSRLWVVLQELLSTNMQQNLQLVVQVAKEYTEQLGANKIIELLESHKSYHGLYYYLGSSIAFSEDPEVLLTSYKLSTSFTHFRSFVLHTMGSSHHITRKQCL